LFLPILLYSHKD
ncbi:D-3-phosphoglycerate dehydrogenase domain protein, partial [Vibrio parahaemolyticus VP2007-007]